ncbi:MAG: carbohydrate binding family 9 domain-containing protein [Ignavibacteriae bacterium]|nr:carbohydrate binding family 9 domain-containing protein [Ignavibacteriota bacterium]
MKNLISPQYYLFLITSLILFLPTDSFAQNTNQKIIRVHNYDGGFELDGKLNESFWQNADSIDGLTMVEPEENSKASYKTIIKIIVDNENIILGVKCFDDPTKIIAYSKARDVELEDEDNIKFVFDTYRDERNGYIFSVNPLGARYDAIVAYRGEHENSNWDGVWDAKTNITEEGWSAEIIIPIKTLSFKSGLHEWGFNIERKIQRLLEKDRWTAIHRNYNVISLSRAGIISGLPNFDLGLGLLLKFSPTVGFHKSYNDEIIFDKDISGDVTKRITPDISATLTINTDFAETEVDTRQTNLTRFPLFFPEKRTFFLEGADIYDFGLGLGFDVIPFFSRRIGLYDEEQVPITFGTKLNGKVGNTNFGGLYVRTNQVDSLVPSTNMGVVRIKQNIFEQSNIGIIATGGDPSGINNSWLLGADFTYQISDLFKDKNFLFGVWGLYSNRPDLSGDKKSYGLKIDYPNDLFDIAFSYKHIGDAFEPSLGFVPRLGIKKYRFSLNYMPRPNRSFIRQFFFESFSRLVTDLGNKWESYSVFTAPIHFLMESGDRFEFNIRPVGERLAEPFEIEEGIILPIDEYNYLRYRLELESASKRLISGEATWWFGTFYTGTLDQIEFSITLRFTSNIILGLNYEKNIVELKEGSFDQELFGARLQLNYSPNLQLSSFVQYDSESSSFGTNTRMRWTITPLTDLYVVYNHNINKILKDRWQFESNQFIVKLSYGLWY